MNEEREKAMAAGVEILVQNGFSREDARLVIDLSAHAVSEMELALMRVADTAPMPLTLAVAISGLSAMEDRIPSLIAEIKSVLATVRTIQ